MGFLIKCRTCGKQVSSTAKMCPHCGESSPEPYKERVKYSAIAIIGIAIVIVGGWNLFLIIKWILW